MAANYIDVSADDEDGAIAVVVAGTVTNDIRVVYNDDAEPTVLVEAAKRALNKLVRDFG